MKKKESTNEKLMYEIAQENKGLSEPLNKALKEVKVLRQQLQNYEKDKISLSHANARLLDTEKQLKNLAWEHEVLEQRFQQMEVERDELYDKFERSIYDVQQKSGLKNLLLERKLETLHEQLEKKEAQLGEVLATANIDPATLDQVKKSLDEVLEQKNFLIKVCSCALNACRNVFDSEMRI